MLAALFIGAMFAGPIQSWSFAEFAIAIIAVIAICAIVYAFCQWAGITIPPMMIRVILIVIAAVFCIAAIRIVAGI